MTKLTDELMNEYFGEVEYAEEIELNSLDELVQYLDTFKIPSQYQNVFIHLNSPIQLIYINNTHYTPICDENILEKKSNLIQNMANYHLQEKQDFYCAIRDEYGNHNSEIPMFGNWLIQYHHKLMRDSLVEIPEPKIIIPSADQIAFPTVYDERTFTKENLELDNQMFGNYNQTENTQIKNKLN